MSVVATRVARELLVAVELAEDWDGFLNPLVRSVGWPWPWGMDLFWLVVVGCLLACLAACLLGCLLGWSVVGWLVGWSVGRSVGWLVGWLVGWFTH